MLQKIADCLCNVFLASVIGLGIVCLLEHINLLEVPMFALLVLGAGTLLLPLFMLALIIFVIFMHRKYRDW